MNSSEIICVGEILWDSFPAGMFLGGAPFNVAHDLHMLGNKARIISKVGKDALGDETMKRLKAKGMSTGLIQVDDKRPTGLVEVTVDRKGNPTYHIKDPAAWDAIEIGENLLRTVGDAAMLVYGTLGCRNEITRKTILGLIPAASLRIFDVNLRPGAVNRDLVGELLSAADIVKVNIEELGVLRKWYGLPAGEREASEELAAKFSNELVGVSMGSDGGSIWHEGSWVHHPGFRVRVKTTVGAGDAFLAGLLSSLLEGRSDAELVETANVLGAYVVTRNEATPEFDRKDLESIRENVNSL